LTYNDLELLFPRMVSGKKVDIAVCTRALVDPKRTDVPAGSSFAVISGIATAGRLRLYLSEASYRHLVGKGLVKESDLHATRSTPRGQSGPSVH
jgi:hypothetical protein